MTDPQDSRPGVLEAKALGKSRPDGYVFFKDSHGALWEVHEVRTSAASPWARGEKCLLFTCRHVIRRVWHYPADWRELSPPELEELSWQV